jgi:probable rRNA maturation factor
MISVLITSESRYKFERAKIRQAIIRLLKKEKLDDVEVSLAVVGSRKIRQLNQQYRQVDEVTDVLSFSLEEARGPNGQLRLGDIVLCYPVAREQARIENKLVVDKMMELVEHGLKHLLGEHHDE